MPLIFNPVLGRDQMVTDAQVDQIRALGIPEDVWAPINPFPDWKPAGVKPPDDPNDSVGWSDYGNLIMQGGAQTGLGAGWLIDKVLPDVVFGERDLGKVIMELSRDAVEYWNNRLSDAAKRELAKEFVHRNEDGSYEWGDASIQTVGLLGASSLMGTGAGMGAGAAITKGLQLAGLGLSAVLKVFGNPVGYGRLVDTIKMGTTLAADGKTRVLRKNDLTGIAAKAAIEKKKVVDTVLGAVGFGAGEGLVSAGAAGINVQDAVMARSHEQLMEVARYRQVYDAAEGMEEERRRLYAKETIANEAATTAGWQSGLTVAAAGAPMGAFFGRIMGSKGIGVLPDEVRSRLGNIAIGAAGEAGQEAVQSGFEQIYANRAIRQNADPRQRLGEGVINAIVGGAIAGGALGGVFGAAAPVQATRDIDEVSARNKPTDKTAAQDKDPTPARLDQQVPDPWNIGEALEGLISSQDAAILEDPVATPEDKQAALQRIFTNPQVKEVLDQKFGGQDAGQQIAASEPLESRPNRPYFTDQEGAPRLPISDNAPPEQQLEEIHQLTAENKPVVDKIADSLRTIKDVPRVEVSIKKDKTILEKAARPLTFRGVKAGVQYVNDTLRFRAGVQSADALIDVARTVATNPEMGVITRFDASKMRTPSMWGWRTITMDFQMPNGQMVEFYTTFEPILKAVDGAAHKIYSKWRDKKPEQLTGFQRVEFRADLMRSRKLYEDGLRQGLGSLSLSQFEKSLKSLESELESSIAGASFISPKVASRRDQPLSSLTKVPSVVARTGRPSESRTPASSSGASIQEDYSIFDAPGTGSERLEEEAETPSWMDESNATEEELQREENKLMAQWGYTNDRYARLKRPKVYAEITEDNGDTLSGYVVDVQGDRKRPIEFGREDIENEMRFSKYLAGLVDEPVPLSSLPPVSEQRLSEVSEYLNEYLTPEEQALVTRAGLVSIARFLDGIEKGDLTSAPEIAAMAAGGSLARGWYARSMKAIADIFGPESLRFTYLLAAMSPQQPVPQDLMMSLRVWSEWNKQGRPDDPDRLMAIFRSVPGASLEARAKNATNVLSAPDDDALRGLVLSGPKADSFMMNLLGIMQEVTLDAWMAHAFDVDKKIFGGNAEGLKSPRYLATVAIIREAATLLSDAQGVEWTPAEVQETVWSWAKAAMEARRAAGETRSVLELWMSGELDERIENVPDFAMLMKQENFAEVLQDEYAAQLEALEVEERVPEAGRDRYPDRERLIESAAGRMEQRFQRSASGQQRAAALRKQLLQRYDGVVAELERIERELGPRAAMENAEYQAKVKEMDQIENELVPGYETDKATIGDVLAFKQQRQAGVLSSLPPAGRVEAGAVPGGRFTVARDIGEEASNLEAELIPFLGEKVEPSRYVRGGVFIGSDGTVYDLPAGKHHFDVLARLADKLGLMEGDPSNRQRYFALNFEKVSEMAQGLPMVRVRKSGDVINVEPFARTTRAAVESLLQIPGKFLMVDPPGGGRTLEARKQDVTVNDLMRFMNGGPMPQLFSVPKAEIEENSKQFLRAYREAGIGRTISHIDNGRHSFITPDGQIVTSETMHYAQAYQLYEERKLGTASADGMSAVERLLADAGWVRVSTGGRTHWVTMRDGNLTDKQIEKLLESNHQLMIEVEGAPEEKYLELDAKYAVPRDLRLWFDTGKEPMLFSLRGSVIDQLQEQDLEDQEPEEQDAFERAYADRGWILAPTKAEAVERFKENSPEVDDITQKSSFIFQDGSVHGDRIHHLDQLQRAKLYGYGDSVDEFGMSTGAIRTYGYGALDDQSMAVTIWKPPTPQQIEKLLSKIKQSYKSVYIEAFETAGPAKRVLFGEFDTKYLKANDIQTWLRTGREPALYSLPQFESDQQAIAEQLLTDYKKEFKQVKALTLRQAVLGKDEDELSVFILPDGSIYGEFGTYHFEQMMLIGFEGSVSDFMRATGAMRLFGYDTRFQKVEAAVTVASKPTPKQIEAMLRFAGTALVTMDIEESASPTKNSLEEMFYASDARVSDLQRLFATGRMPELFSVSVTTKEIEAPNRPEPGRTPLTVTQLKESIADILEEVRTIADVVIRERPWVPGSNPTSEGAYFEHSNRIELYADNLFSEQRAREVIAHELVGHFAVLRRDEFRSLIEVIKGMIRLQSDVVKDIAKEVDGRYHHPDEDTLAKEVVSAMAERGVEADIIDRFIAAVRKFLRSLGIVYDYSNEEIRTILANAYKTLRYDNKLLETWLDVPEVVEGLEQERGKDQTEQLLKSVLLSRAPGQTDLAIAIGNRAQEILNKYNGVTANMPVETLKEYRWLRGLQRKQNIEFKADKALSPRWFDWGNGESYEQLPLPLDSLPQLKDPRFSEWFGGSVIKNRDTDQPLVVYHGTTHDITDIMIEKSSWYSYTGRGFYTTTNPEDASINYSDTRSSPDFRFYVGKEEELIRDEIRFASDQESALKALMDEYEQIPDRLHARQEAEEKIRGRGIDGRMMTQDVIYEIAQFRLRGTNNGVIYPVFIKAENPFYMADIEPTDPIAYHGRTMLNGHREVLEGGDLAEEHIDQIVELASDAMSEIGYPDVMTFAREFRESLALNWSIPDHSFHALARAIVTSAPLEPEVIAVNPRTAGYGTPAAEVARRVLDGLGYDAIITSPRYAFFGQVASRGLHVHTWKPGSVKSISAQQWDQRSANILESRPRAIGSDAVEAILERTIEPPVEDVTLRDRFRRYVKDIKQSFDVTAFKQAFIDGGAAIEAYEREQYGELLDAAESPTKAYALTKNIHSVMSAVLVKDGVPVFRNGWFEARSGRKPLMQILEPLIHHREGNLLHLWGAWAAANRAKKLIGQKNRDGTPREKLFSQEDIDELMELENRYRGPNHSNLFREVLAEWEAMNQQALDLAESVGALDPETRQLWDDNAYVPFYRFLEEAQDLGGPVHRRGLSGQRVDPKRLRGSEKPLNDIIENMVMNLSSIIDTAYKNAAMQKIVWLTNGYGMEQVNPDVVGIPVTVEQLARALESGGLAVGTVDGPEFVRGLTKQQKEMWTRIWRRRAPVAPDTITVYYDGKPRYFKVHDSLLLKSINNVGAPQFNAWMDLFRVPKRVLTRGITLDPAFMVANYLRDTLSAWVIGGQKMVPLIDSMKGLKKALNEDPSMRAIWIAGGGGGGFYDTNPTAVRKMLAQKVSDTEMDGFLRTIISPKKWLRAYDRIGNASEQANRIAIFDRVIEAGGSTAEAAYQAMDLLNFTRSGDSAAAQFLVQSIPFLNARVQGLEKLWRAGKDNPSSVALKMLMITAASLALLMRNRDRDEYNELPEWDKDVYWHIFLNPVGSKVKDGDHWRIPKPFELGALSSTVPERVFRAATGDEDWEVTKKSMLTMIGETLALNPVPQIGKPVIELWGNRDFFFGTPILSSRDKGLLPEQQYNPYTSETMIELAKMMPDIAPDALRSPKRLQHLLRGYFGQIGMYVAGVADYFTQRVAGYPEGPDRNVYDTPVVKRFMRNPNPRTTRFTEAMFEMFDEVNDTYRTVNRLKLEGRYELAQETLLRNRNLLANRKRINSAYKAISALNKQATTIIYHPTMTGTEKRQRLDEINEKKNELLRTAIPVIEASI